MCKIDGVPRPIIIENDDDTHVHAEHILIDYLEKRNVVTQNDEGIHADKNLQDNLEEKPFIQKKITVYINNSPCAACAKKIEKLLRKKPGYSFDFICHSLVQDKTEILSRRS